MKKHIILFTLGLCILSILNQNSPAQELAADSKTILLLHFNGNATGAHGETPSTVNNILYETGIFNQAAYIAAGSQLNFSAADNINAAEGTIEFWIKPRWSGTDNFSYCLFSWGNQFYIVKDGGNNLRFIINLDDSEAYKAYYLKSWKSSDWHHVAVTWKIPGTMKTYVDGKLAFSNSASAADLYTSTSAQISIGSIGGKNFADAVFDELRISGSERTDIEIESSYLAGLNFTELVLDFKYQKMLVTWMQKFTVYGLVNGAEYLIPDSRIAWTISDTTIASFNSDKKLVARKAGKITITASFKGISFSQQIEVTEPVLPPTVETIDPYLSTPAKNYIFKMPVVIIRFMPTTDGINVDETKAGYTSTIADLKTRIDIFNKRAKFMLEEGSRFHGYKDPAALPSLGYQVLYMITIYEEYPLDKEVPWNKGHYFPDYNQILTRINAKNFVENLDVKEFWIWGWHTDLSEQPESNMSSPTTGDISNSSRFEDDLPIFNKTYTVYGYNFTRLQSEAVHNHGHQLESILAHANYLQDKNYVLFVEGFMGVVNGKDVVGRGGNCHCPPNTTTHYDYQNLSLVESDCEDWNPLNNGQKKLVNADTWGNLIYNWPDANPEIIPAKVESQYYIYWFQNMPGYSNNIKFENKYLTNWWEFTADWDKAINNKLGLYASDPSSVQRKGVEIPDEYNLSQNYPNPFNPATTINFQIPAVEGFKAAGVRVTLKIFDTLGREIAALVDEEKQPGYYGVKFDAKNLSSGIYYYKFTAGGYTDVKKMIFLR